MDYKGIYTEYDLDNMLRIKVLKLMHKPRIPHSNQKVFMKEISKYLILFNLRKQGRVQRLS